MNTTIAADALPASDARRIEIIVYDGAGVELSHRTYNGPIERVREMDDVLSNLTRRWGGGAV